MILPSRFTAWGSIDGLYRPKYIVYKIWTILFGDCLLYLFFSVEDIIDYWKHQQSQYRR